MCEILIIDPEKLCYYSDQTRRKQEEQEEDNNKKNVKANAVEQEIIAERKELIIKF
jgi:hypothetical protein